MDSEQAKFLLGACQPSGTESAVPEIAAAIEQAQRDPELAEWLAKERRSDAAIMRKMRQLEPPPDLRARLIAGGMVSRNSRPRQRWWPRLAIAASLLLGCGIAWMLLRNSRETPAVAHAPAGPLRAWQEASVGIFSSPTFHLDLEAKSYPPLEAHLRASGASVAGALPFSDAIVEAVGCKVLDWRGNIVSLACFHSDSGELVHLFVVARGAVDETPLEHGAYRAQVGDYATVTWRRGDLVVMVASKLSAPQLERALSANARAASRAARSIIVASAK